MSISYFREKSNINLLLRDNLDYPPHLHQSIEIAFSLFGEGDVYCDGAHYKLNAGDAFISYPNQVHYYENFSKGLYYVLLIPFDIVDSSQAEIIEMYPLSAVAHLSEGDRLHEVLKIMRALWCRNNDKIMMRYFVNAILRLIISDFDMASRKNKKITVSEQVTQYLSEHFKEKVAVDTVAKALFISKSTVSRIFSQRLKISFNDYVNLLRLNEFFNIYENEKCSITAAALSAGFSTVRTFNNVFMKHYGISPSEYVKNKK
ncbi:MAG: helix-turn-helix transcriptional regulator [Clostridia bacterium]|nr:helix-turn-helix transcriptional regulator [Clostridia bacterium]